MNFKGFKAKWDRTVIEVWTLRIVILALVFANIVLTVSLIIKSSNQRTVILPPVVKKPFWTTDSAVSRGYLYDMGDYLSQNLLTFSPKTYDESLGEFMKFVYPKDYKYMRSRLQTQMQDIAALNVSEVFYPQRINFKFRSIIVHGILSRFGSDKKSVSKQKTIVFKYLISSGRFYVTSVSIGR